jgi:hypothetical protein
MRRPAVVLLMFALTACGGGTPEPRATPPPTPPEQTSRKPVTLTCGSSKLKIPAMPRNLTRAATFTHMGSLARPLRVRGVTWRDGGEQLRVGVVCGVRTAEQFATLVARSTLSAYRGKPALRWTTRGDLRNFMWLQRPGTAVYIAATPGLTAQLKRTASAIK